MLKLRKKEILLALASLFISLLLAEGVLRVMGYQPGRFLEPINITAVDSFVLYRGITADSFAVTCLDTTPRSEIRKFIADGMPDDMAFFFNRGWVSEYDNLFTDYYPVLHAEDTGTFARFVKTVLAKTDKTDFDSALTNYVQCPLNEHGFRSMSFRKKSSKKRVLLLGDSFTYGYNAKNKTHSFPDLLVAAGYEVYNTGIGGSDAPQYMDAVREFVPLYQPDFVVANICIGNDSRLDSQSYKPFQPHHYVGNAGWVESCPAGVNYDSPQEVYDLNLSICYIPETNFFNKLCAKTCITTLIWGAFRFTQQEPPVYKAFLERAQLHRLNEPYINRVVNRIQKICDDNGSAFVISIIPNCMPVKGSLSNPQTEENFKLQQVADFENLFPSQTYFEPRNIGIMDYGPNDSHFNEQGHKKYAAHLTHVLDSLSNTVR